MNLRQLVGKKVIRNKPVEYNNGNLDYSYTSINNNSITVIDIINNIPILRFENITGEKIASVGLLFDDDNWIDVTEAHDFIIKANNILEKENKDGKRE